MPQRRAAPKDVQTAPRNPHQSPCYLGNLENQRTPAPPSPLRPEDTALTCAKLSPKQQRLDVDFKVSDDMVCSKLHLIMRKNFFPLRVTEPWHRLPRGAVESPSLEIFKTCLDKVLCRLL